MLLARPCSALSWPGGVPAPPFARQFYGTPSSDVWVDGQGVAHHVAQGEIGEQGDWIAPFGGLTEVVSWSIFACKTAAVMSKTSPVQPGLLARQAALQLMIMHHGRRESRRSGSW
eukprot:s3641_g16.t1